MLQATNLTLWRGLNCLFERLEFRVEAGGALLVRGPNGAGKTSLLRVVCGLTRADEGEVLWADQPAATALRGQVEYAGHQPALKADLTVRQNLDFCTRVSPPHADLGNLLQQLHLAQCADLEVRYLSAGQKRRVGLARVLMSAAPLWLLDEPFTNMDQDGRRLVEERIGRHLSKGGLAMIVAHDEVRLASGCASTLQIDGCRA